ncbi:PREDICTED: uncharacterized protein LOC105143017 [Acromyrmex echinatior]|uniref:uncharacterized protein LOC105143017 n=1 Tax=Acromyrmex echinatior TaxID=103372 RepID=UPI000580F4B7|nr:PREDICTED: uncharacterized protein LOC105143017 [Acromyrmex echinatior]
MDDLRPRRTITGALIWEVQSNREKADALADKQVRKVYRDRDDVRVTRPVKSVEIRITGLNDSVTSKDVVEELARKCEKSPASISRWRAT